MAHIELKNIKKSFGLVDVIKGVDLEVFSGEFMVFVGPSGCGKSTLLRLMAGLEDITSGEMTFDGTLVNALAPSKRGIAMVFQSYALYPHMSVRENLAFGLEIARTPAAEIRRQVDAAAEILKIGPLLDSHKFDIGDMLRESLAAEGEALGLYRELLDLVKDRSVPLEEFARQMINVEELHAGEVDKMLRRPGAMTTAPERGTGPA